MNGSIAYSFLLGDRLRHVAWEPPSNFPPRGEELVLVNVGCVAWVLFFACDVLSHLACVCLFSPLGGRRTRAERVVDAPIGAEEVIAGVIEIILLFGYRPDRFYGSRCKRVACEEIGS